MIDGIRFKVCGLTSLVDAEFADRCGADYLGFIFHPESPRNLTLALGRQTATPLQMSRGFAVFANGGFRVEAYFIERIEDATGAVVRALTRRIVISMLLFVFLLVGWKLGWLQPHGIN